jgi:integrase
VVPGRVSAATLSNYDAVARQHIIPSIGRKKLAKFTPIDVQSLLREKETHRLPRKDGAIPEGGYSARTVRLIRTVLVMAIGQAERWGLVVRNVAALTDGPRLERSEGRTLTVEQAKKLLETARGDRLEACYVTLLALGLRRGEALGLSWADVDLKKELLRVRRGLKREKGVLVLGDLKTASSRRTLNLPNQVTEALRTHKAKQTAERSVAGPDWQDTGLVFTTPLGSAVDPDNFRHRFSRLTTKAGLGHWHPHELRHSAASPMLAAAEAMGRVLWSDGS